MPTNTHHNPSKDYTKYRKSPSELVEHAINTLSRSCAWSKAV